MRLQFRLNHAPRFARPEYVADASDCWFYHSFDLPTIGEVHGHWDLRPTVDAYLGHLDFSGKRVLDVGTASGFLTFAMEQRGASVVSFDMAASDQWDAVPYAAARPDRLSAADVATRKRRELEAMRRGYWLAHRLLESRARLCHGSIQDLPVSLGRFDTVVLGMVLPHLRDPFGALASVARLRPRELVITQQMPQTEAAIGYFMPTATSHDLYDAWWSLSAPCLERMLGILGYQVVHSETSEHACVVRGGPEACTTLVAEHAVSASSP